MKTWQYLLAMPKRSPKSSGVYDADAPQPVRSKNRNDSRKWGLSRSWSGLAGCPPLLLRRSGSCSLRRPKGDLWSGHAPGDGRAGRSLDMVECFLITGPFHGMPLIKKFAKRSIRDLVVAAFAFQQIASSICFYVVSSAFVLAREATPTSGQFASSVTGRSNSKERPSLRWYSACLLTCGFKCLLAILMPKARTVTVITDISSPALPTWS